MKTAAGERFACVARALVSLIYPARCENCGTGVEHPQYLCAKCAASAARIEAPFCEVCSEPFRGAISGRFACANCAGRSFYFTCAVARYRSEGVVREFIHRFKYQREFQLRHPLAAWAAEALEDERIRADRVDALVPVPLFAARERHREFNQAEALGRLVGKGAGIAVSDCLIRTRNTARQVGHDRRSRMENLRNAFRMRQNTAVSGRHLVLVDDVLTTGSTLDECARVLIEAGAASVRAITVARG
jgi:ComF family protein